ncbi:CHAT domain-containing protein [Rhizobium leguminosarum]|uniref:CHAT domain-containing protein n=1 Tax=Rhizobium leguminosarum TaxID=384 RepID=A0A1B1C771_RHILE|nr:CHAT domain-containing protein [Rhizobium leguminosarum]ANP85591.1 hypothetical protein BA011_07495 [Rhizobium leguminosarum]
MTSRRTAANFGSPTVSLPSREWEATIEFFQREFPGALRTIRLSFNEGFGDLYAEVASEAAKAFLLDLFEKHPMIRRLEANVEVVGVFRPANQRDAFDTAFNRLGEGAQDGKDAGETVQRHPHIKALGELRVGAEVAIKVGLEVYPDGKTSGGPSDFGGLPTGWEAFEVEVILTSLHLDFADNQFTKVIQVKRAGRSQAALFDVVVNEHAVEAGIVQVDANFMFEGRRCGEARRVFEVVQDSSNISVAEPDPKPQAGFTNPAEIRRNMPSAELSIFIHHDGNTSDGLFRWSGYSKIADGEKKTTSGTINLGSSRQSFVQQLFSRCGKLDKDALKRTFRSVGEDLWKKMPSDFRAQYLKLVEASGASFPIQIYSEEPLVPWELMWPSEPDANVELDHLFMNHPIARWRVGEREASYEFRAGTIASFVPDYGRGDTLPAALAEGKWLTDRFGAIAHKPTAEAFLDLLENPPNSTAVQLLHFAGHGANGDQTRGANIEMTDRPLAVDEVKQSGVKLGRRDRSFVVLNACKVGASTLELESENGWASALIGNGFGAVLAPLWIVQDEYASSLIKGTLESFLGDQKPLGEALRDARKACRETSATPYAYILHGDVMARSLGRAHITS